MSNSYFNAATIERTEEELALFDKFAEVWGPIFKEDPRFGIPIENFLNQIRREMVKPPCFGLDDCSSLQLINCKVANLCGSE